LRVIKKLLYTELTYVVNNMEVCKEIKNRITKWPNNLSSRHMSKGNEITTYKHFRTTIFITTLLTTAKTREQRKYSSMHKWIKNCLHVYEPYSTLKEWALAIRHNNHEPVRHYAKWEKPDTERKILHSVDLTYTKNLRKIQRHRQN
jgi:hypothetical protein